MGSDLSSTGLLHSTGARPRAAAPGLLCGRGGGFDAALGAGCFLVVGAPAAAEAGRGRRAGWRTGAARDAARSATLWPCVGPELLGLPRLSGCGPRGPPRCPISAAFDLAAGRRKSGAERLGPTDDTRTPRACPIWLCVEAPSLAACDSRDIILQAMKKFQSWSFKSSPRCVASCGKKLQSRHPCRVSISPSSIVLVSRALAESGLPGSDLPAFCLAALAFARGAAVETAGAAIPPPSRLRTGRMVADGAQKPPPSAGGVTCCRGWLEVMHMMQRGDKAGLGRYLVPGRSSRERPGLRPAIAFRWRA